MLQKSLLCIFIFLFAACGNSEKTPLCSNDKDAGEYEVFSAIIEKLYGNSGKPILIREKTLLNENNFKLAFNKEWLEMLGKDFPDLDESTAEGFNAANEQSYSLERKFNISMPYQFVSEKDWAEISADYLKRYDAFEKKFPGDQTLATQRTLLFSKAGFNKDFSQAVVFVRIWNDRASYFFLKRENCRWKVVKDNNVSVH